MLTNRGKSKVFGMYSNARFPFLIKITNDDLGEFCYVNMDNDITFEGCLYKASYFEVSPPEKSEGVIGNAKITLSAVDQEWIKRIRSTQKRSRIQFVAAVVYDDNGEQIVESRETLSFVLTSVNWDELSISWDMEYDEILSINIPCDIADSLNVAGCA